MHFLVRRLAKDLVLSGMLQFSTSSYPQKHAQIVRDQEKTLSKESRYYRAGINESTVHMHTCTHT